MLTLAQFTATTIGILMSNGIDEYQPTLVLLDDQVVIIIDDILLEVDHRRALLKKLLRTTMIC